MTLAALLSRLGRVRRTGNGYLARCPAHEDRVNSLSVGDGEEGRILLKCHSGCEVERIAKALGLTVADLFPTRGWTDRPRATRYEVRDPSGALVAVHVREDRADGKRLWWERPAGTRGLGGQKTATLPLYGVHELPADHTVPSVITEGEKARDALKVRGIAAVATVTGADGTPNDEALRPLLGHPVLLWPDADDPGRAHMARITTALQRLGHRDVRVVTWREAPAKGDAFDFFARGGTVDAARQLLETAATWTPTGDESTREPRTRAANPWVAALDAPTFLAGDEADLDFLEARMLAPGSVTQIYSPRGLGKTHYAHHLAVKQARAGKRVLYIDRDNSRREVRRRFRAWGAADAPTLKILTRDQAPPLTDTAAWAQFPFQNYDLVIIDSIDAATEGVGEQSSEKPSKAIAPILDIAHREAGPAILLLGNVVKSGAHSRGSGVIEDRSDIVYEVRDATGLAPSGSKPWIEELPAADAGSWAARASRRQRRDTYRLAFVPTKFRIGEEPEPFIVEIDLRAEPWVCCDVTEEVDRAGVEARAKLEADRRATETAAATALLREIQRRAAAGDPLHARAEAEPFLVNLGVKRQAARDLLRGRDGDLWRIEERPGAHGRAKVLLPVPNGEVSPDAGHKGGVAESRARSGDSEPDSGRQLQMRSAANGAREAAPDAAIVNSRFVAAGETKPKFPGYDPRDPEPGPEAPPGAWGAWRRRQLERETAARPPEWRS